MKDALVPLATFLATALTTSAAFWQWQRTNNRGRSQAFRERRTEALKALWTALQDAEETQRNALYLQDMVAAGQVSDQIRDVNLMLLRSAPFLQSDEMTWARTMSPLLSSWTHSRVLMMPT